MFLNPSPLLQRIGDDVSLPSSFGLDNSQIEVFDPVSGVKVGDVNLDIKLVSYGEAGKLLLHHVHQERKRMSQSANVIRSNQVGSPTDVIDNDNIVNVETAVSEKGKNPIT